MSEKGALESIGDLAGGLAETSKTLLEITNTIIDIPNRLWKFAKDVFKDVKEGTGDVYETLTKPREPRLDLPIYKNIKPAPDNLPLGAKARWLYEQRISELKKAIDGLSNSAAYALPRYEEEQLKVAIDRIKVTQTAVYDRKKELIKKIADREMRQQRLGIQESESTLNLGNGSEGDIDSMSLAQLRQELDEIDGKLLMTQPWPTFVYNKQKGVVERVPGSEGPTNLSARLATVQRDPSYRAGQQYLELIKYEITANQYVIDKINEPKPADVK